MPNSLKTLPSYVIFFVSGIAGLMYKISWSRQLGVLFGHTVQVASILLAAYFAGMALGSLLGARLGYLLDRVSERGHCRQRTVS